MVVEQEGMNRFALFFLYFGFAFLMFILVSVASEAVLISCLNRLPVNGPESHVRGCRK